MPFQILREKDDDQSLSNKILRATKQNQITLATKIFGRGSDFRVYDNRVIEEGGLVII